MEREMKQKCVNIVSWDTEFTLKQSSVEGVHCFVKKSVSTCCIKEKSFHYCPFCKGKHSLLSVVYRKAFHFCQLCKEALIFISW